jgi:methyl-accepting chemotaxis protein
MVQLSFSVVAARVDVTPSKPLFDRGNTVKFDISNDFDLPDSYIKIYSPADTLWWITDDLIDEVWIQPNTLYTVPYYRQTANENPMDLASDAPMGTWTFFFYDLDDIELMNGTFEVGPSTAAQVDELLGEVRSDIESLAGDVAGVTDDIQDDIDALSSEIGDVASDVDGLKDEIVGDLADDIASATAAANAAGDAIDDLENSLDNLKDSVGDIADTADSAESAANAAADAASDAASAAEDASSAASGLTTLVYGAIGASLIAALAAIVSLMQISKKIAG